ncbi:hypothetical protein BS50DRAFT_572558 [Corynespora cassiicola Philippines]|uniref:Cell wall protein n=1 Tax=Corynespora cassiicola Philippines TaxID=1448308 RepID=A0A2T2NVI7_CORCC|nr:hypothetical protein BS50DRAFT_572558 [Corynespora cassiicola Philippines]
MKFPILATIVFGGSAFAFPAPQQPSGGNSTCNAQKVAVLMGGINANLDIQAQELKGVQTLQKLAASNTTLKALDGSGPSNFELTKQNVLAIQQKGIDIRAENQRLAGELNSPSQMGLAIVAMAQVTEKMQVEMLQGGGEKDMKTLETLVKEVEDGTKQNTMNLQMAQSQCQKPA